MGLTKEFDKLLEKRTAVGLDAEETRRLGELLSGCPDLRKRYLESSRDDALLGAVVAERVEKVIPSPFAEAIPAPHGGRSWPIWPLGIAAALIAMAAGTFGFLVWKTKSTVANTVVANVYRVEDVVWAGGSRWFEGSAKSSNDILELKSGVVALDLSSGTRLIVEGPAKLRIPSSHHGHLDYGKVVVFSTASEDGFTLTTPVATLLGRGSQFGANQNREDSSLYMQTYEGNAELVVNTGGEKGSSVFLADRESVRLTADGNVHSKDIRFTPDAFVTSLSPVENPADSKIARLSLNNGYSKGYKVDTRPELNRNLWAAEPDDQWGFAPKGVGNSSAEASFLGEVWVARPDRGEDPPMLTTRISGCEPGKEYRVYVYWSQIVPFYEWGFLGGFDPENMARFDGWSGSPAGERLKATTEQVILLGTQTADSEGSVTLHLDNINGPKLRTQLTGIGIEPGE